LLRIICKFPIVSRKLRTDYKHRNRDREREIEELEVKGDGGRTEDGREKKNSGVAEVRPHENFHYPPTLHGLYNLGSLWVYSHSSIICSACCVIRGLQQL